VYIIVNAGLKKVKISVVQVILASHGTCLLIGIYMLLSNIFSPLVERQRTSTAITGQYTYYYSCQSTYPASDYVLYAVEGLILLINLILCWKTRMVPGVINKSAAIARVNVSVAIVALIIFAVEASESLVLDPWVESTMTAVAFFFCCLQLFVHYFAPTVYYLLFGYDLDRNLKLVKKSDLEAQKAAAGAKVAVTSGTASSLTPQSSNKKKEKHEHDEHEVVYADEEQRLLVAKYMPHLAPKSIGECNELVSFLQAQIAELSVVALRFHGDTDNSSDKRPSSVLSSVHDELAPEVDQLIKYTHDQHVGHSAPGNDNGTSQGSFQTDMATATLMDTLKDKDPASHNV
jgi:hypothetical protein